jgi:hypothetical protein
MNTTAQQNPSNPRTGIKRAITEGEVTHMADESAKETPNKSPKEIRTAAGVSLVVVAVRAKTTEHTARIYEANREAVSQSKREALDRVYAELERPALKPMKIRRAAEKGGAR